MANQAAPTVQMQNPATNAPAQGKGQIPFRKATLERVTQLAAETNVAMTAATQPINRVIEGAGLIYGIVLDVTATSATSTAASVAAYAEDAPFNVLDTVMLSDNNADIFNLKGFETWVAMLADGIYRNEPNSANAPGAALPSATGVGGVGTTASQDTNQVLNVGAVGTASTTANAGGNFRFQVRLSVGVNRRSLLGILGNQDRAQKYDLTTNISGSATVFSTAPSSLPNISINKFYENYSIPLANAPDGSPQQMIPPNFGVVNFHKMAKTEAAPSNGSTIQHYIRRIGNTLRWMALEFRSATVGGGTPLRGNADANPPSSIKLYLGEDTTFNESWQYRRFLMSDRYGFDMPRGLLIFDWIHDFGPFAGAELGDDYIFSQALVNAAFEIVYPATASTWQAGSSLTVVTSDLVRAKGQVARVSA